MSREEIQKLLGGYATDTLSEAERRALFEAALEDRELFDALAKEQALRDVLQDPSARQQLIEALGPVREPFAARAWRWLRRPAAVAMAGGLAALLIVAGLVLRQTMHPARREVLLADATAANAAHPPAPAATEHLAAPQHALESSAVERKPKRAAQLPAPPVLAVPQPPAAKSEAAGDKISAPPDAPPAAPSAAPAPPPAAVAAGALGGPSQASGQNLQVQVQAQGFVTRDEPAMAAKKLALTAPSAIPKFTVEYALLLKGADGAYSPVPLGAVFHVGDAVRLQVQPSAAGYVYLFQRDAAAGWNPVASQRVEKDQRYELPPTADLQSDMPAQLELLLVLSRLERPAFAIPQTDASLVGTRAPAGQLQVSFKITVEYR